MSIQLPALSFALLGAASFIFSARPCFASLCYSIRVYICSFDDWLCAYLMGFVRGLAFLLWSSSDSSHPLLSRPPLWFVLCSGFILLLLLCGSYVIVSALPFSVLVCDVFHLMC